MQRSLFARRANLIYLAKGGLNTFVDPQKQGCSAKYKLLIEKHGVKKQFLANLACSFLSDHNVQVLYRPPQPLDR